MKTRQHGTTVPGSRDLNTVGRTPERGDEALLSDQVRFPRNCLPGAGDHPPPTYTMTAIHAVYSGRIDIVQMTS